MPRITAGSVAEHVAHQEQAVFDAAIALFTEHGYSHVTLAAGELAHGALSGGIQRGPVRVAGVLDLSYVAYHGDPDVLVEHPGVDLVTREGGVTPSLGIESGYKFSRTVSAGGFVRAALRELTVYDGGGGDIARARLILVGAFLDVRLR